jgi:hypothetical protein
MLQCQEEVVVFLEEGKYKNGPFPSILYGGLKGKNIAMVEPTSTGGEDLQSKRMWRIYKSQYAYRLHRQPYYIVLLQVLVAIN